MIQVLKTKSTAYYSMFKIWTGHDNTKNDVIFAKNCSLRHHGYVTYNFSGFMTWDVKPSYFGFNAHHVKKDSKHRS